jgi:4-alpha-glucanotransferase
MIRCLMGSPANTVILTLQDLLDQGERSRMNIPGLASGNWAYRVPEGATTDKLAEEVRTITWATERLTHGS